MKRVLIKNMLDVDVDGLRAVNHYKVTAMYDEFKSDDVAEIVFETLEEFDLTWKEIDKLGGIGSVLADIKSKYNIA